MTPRRRAILIVALALLLLAVIIFAVLWLWPKSDEAPNIQEPTVTAPTTTDTVEQKPADNPLNPPTVAPTPAPGSTAAQQIAELFAERYGSYSNQGDFQNLRDLLPVMTDKYRAATEAYLSAAATDPNALYEGVTSVKISTDVRSYDGDAGTAVISVTLQQQKTTGGTQAAPTYRSLRMNLQRVGKDWRVDSATWEN